MGDFVSGPINLFVISFLIIFFPKPSISYRLVLVFRQNEIDGQRRLISIIVETYLT